MPYAAVPRAYITGEDVAGSDVDGDGFPVDDDEEVLSWQSDVTSEGNVELDVCVESDPSWSRTMLDTEHARIAEIASHFRDRPLLPPPLPWTAPHLPDPYDPVHSLPYPATHSAFAGCAWCSDSEPCQWTTKPGNHWKVEGTSWVL